MITSGGGGSMELPGAATARTRLSSCRVMEAQIGHARQPPRCTPLTAESSWRHLTGGGFDCPKGAHNRYNEEAEGLFAKNAAAQPDQQEALRAIFSSHITKEPPTV